LNLALMHSRNPLACAVKSRLRVQGQEDGKLLCRHGGSLLNEGRRRHGKHLARSLAPKPL